MPMKTILCFGDSNTWGFIPESLMEPFPRRHPLTVRWTGVLAEVLGKGFRVVEEGQNGRTTVHEDPINICRKGKDYLPACLESHKPVDLVVLMLGTNDLKSIFNAAVSDVANGARVLAQMILDSNTGPANRAPQLLLVCPPEVGSLAHLPDLDARIPNGRARSLELPRHYRGIASVLGCAYLNAQEIVTTSPVDGLHLDAEEHGKLGLAIGDKVKEMLR